MSERRHDIEDEIEEARQAVEDLRDGLQRARRQLEDTRRALLRTLTDSPPHSAD